MDTTKLTKKFGIGLTGGIATGKSTVAQMIKGRGFFVVDADELARMCALPGSETLAKMVSEFGEEILTANKGLNREKLRDLILNDFELKKRLEEIMHPAIRKTLDHVLKATSLLKNPTPWFYEASLLIETNSQNRFKEIWVTYCDESQQVERLIARNNMTSEQAQKFLQAQMPAHEKKSFADVVIETGGSLSDVEMQVENQLKRFY